VNAPLHFSHVSKRYEAGAALAVDDVSLAVPAGQFCVLVGASGAGKSTLLKMANGLVVPTQGIVCFEDTEVTPRTLHRIQPRIGMIHQSFHLVPRLSVLDNVLTGSLPNVSTPAALLHLFPRPYQRKACRLLARVGLSQEHLYRRAMQLSGGQQQRVAIARAFLLDPVLILADEPVASLDPATSFEVLHLLRESARERGATVLCSLHQVELARAFADRIVGMRAGRIIFDGSPEAFRNEAEDAVYAGIPLRSPAPKDASDVLAGVVA
jgi:phosphonate transport system ATP-binding protein